MANDNAKRRTSRAMFRKNPLNKRRGAQRGPETWRGLVRVRYPAAEFVPSGENIKAYASIGLHAEVIGIHTPSQGGWVSKPGPTKRART